MEHLSGETLGQCLARRKRLSVAEALFIAHEIAHGVGHAHRHGIVRRDLKPDNVFLAGTPGHPGPPRIKVLDFGIAKLTTTGSAGGSGSASQTRTGVILGTPLFMAPEQCRGAGKVVLDHRVDVYALGCILHMMLAGEPPFPLDGFGDIIVAHLSAPPPPLRSLAIDPAVPEAVESLVLRLLAKQPADRPDGMEAVAAEITRRSRRWAARAPAPPRRPCPGPWCFRRRRRASRSPAASPPPVRAAPPAAPEPAQPEEVTVVLTINSTPEGTEIVENNRGTVIGTTPFPGRFHAGSAPASFTLRKRGFRPKKLTVHFDKDQEIAVTLDKQAAPPPRERRRAPPAAPRPGDDPDERRKL